MVLMKRTNTNSVLVNIDGEVLFVAICIICTFVYLYHY